MTHYRKKETDKENYVSVVTCDLFNSSDFRVSVSPERLFFLSLTRKRKWWSILCNARAGKGLTLKPSICNLLTVIIQPLSTYLVPNVFVFLSPPTQRHSFFRPNSSIHYAMPRVKSRGWFAEVVVSYVRRPRSVSHSNERVLFVSISCSTNHREYTPIAAAPGYLRSLPQLRPWSACLTWFVSDG